jgi:hypothetical protein
VIDTRRRTGRRVRVDAGGVRPRRGRGLKGHRLAFAEGKEISVVGRRVSRCARSPSGSGAARRRSLGSWSATWIGRAGTGRRLRTRRRVSGPRGPKVAKLVSNLALREKVEHDLEKRYSPEQIVGRLCLEFPDDLEMRVSTETIYQSLYVVSRGALRRVWRCVCAHRAGVTSAQQQGRTTQEPHPQHDQYCGAAR